MAYRKEGSTIAIGLEKQVSSSMYCNISSITMGDSCADNANCMSSTSGRKVHAGYIMRNSSSLSTESSEFEFDSFSFSDQLNDDPPLSPKLLFSPNYTPNYSPHDEESAFMASSNQFCAEKADHLHASNAVYEQQQGSHDDHLPPSFTLNYNGAASSKQNQGLSSSLSRAKSEGESDNCQIRRANNDESRGKFDDISVDNHTDNDNYEAVLRANGEGGRRMDLRSLLNRRDMEHLPPLTNFNHQFKKDNKKQVPVKRNSSAPSSSSASVSPSSSPLNYHAKHSTNRCKIEDGHSYCAGETKSCQKKCRKWGFKLDFLRKSPSPRAEQIVNQSGNDKMADYSPNHGVSSNHCSIAAAANEAAFDNYLNHERDYNSTATAGEAANNQLTQRIDHFRATAAAGEARFNRQINQSVNINHRAVADTAKESRNNHEVNQSTDNYRWVAGGGAAGVITKFESPRHSTCSVISAVSSSPRHGDNEVIKGNYRMISKSAPISPAGSPTRSSHAGAGGEGGFTRGRAPMSPHAVHYKQQKARTEELRRKTFLPYRQSLLGACFYAPQQAVY